MMTGGIGFAIRYSRIFKIIKPGRPDCVERQRRQLNAGLHNGAARCILVKFCK
jgi:hypothetical protein